MHCGIDRGGMHTHSLIDAAGARAERETPSSREPTRDRTQDRRRTRCDRDLTRSRTKMVLWGLVSTWPIILSRRVRVAPALPGPAFACLVVRCTQVTGDTDERSDTEGTEVRARPAAVPGPLSPPRPAAAPRRAPRGSAVGNAGGGAGLSSSRLVVRPRRARARARLAAPILSRRYGDIGSGSGAGGRSRPTRVGCENVRWCGSRTYMIRCGNCGAARRA